MSHWSMYEINNTMWGESDDDHIVPHPGAKQGDKVAAQSDRCEKGRCKEMAIRKNAGSKPDPKDGVQGNRRPTLIEKNSPMLAKASLSSTPNFLFFEAGDSDLMRLNASYSSDDAKMFSNCLSDSNISSLSNEFCDDSIVGNISDLHDSSLRGFLHYDNSCPTRCDLGGNTNEGDTDEGSNLLHYGWPGIGNSEEVDKIFRNPDSLFGQGNTGYEQEMSWLSSSSPSIDVSEHALRSAFITPCSDLRDTSKNGEGGTEFLSDSLSPLIADFDRKNVLSTYRTNTQALSADASALGHSYINYVNAEEQMHLQRKQANDLHQSQGNTEEQFQEYFCGDSLRSSPYEGQPFENEECPSMFLATQVSPPSAILQRNESLGVDAARDEFIPNVQFKYPFTSPQNQITPTRSSTESGVNAHCSFLLNNVPYASVHVPPMEGSGNPSLKVAGMTSEGCIENFYRSGQKQVTSAVLSEHENLLVDQAKAVITDQLPDWKQPEHRNNTVGLRGFEQENSDFDDSSLVATSFWNLQSISEQLDIKTKLCIRDSLYRLARSAEQRHSYGYLNSSSADSVNRRGALTTEEANECSGFMDMEADTNPIDRSIAHLLFNSPLGSSRRLFNDASSLGSCAGNSHIFSPSLSFMFV